jgi:hypothetical protein
MGSGRIRWTASEVEELRRLVALGWDDAAIAWRLRRTRSMVGRQRLKFGIERPMRIERPGEERPPDVRHGRREPAGEPWWLALTASEAAIVRVLWAADGLLSNREIARRVWADWPEQMWATVGGLLRAHISNARRKGVPIANVRGRGYLYGHLVPVGAAGGMGSAGRVA